MDEDALGRHVVGGYGAHLSLPQPVVATLPSFAPSFIGKPSNVFVCKRICMKTVSVISQKGGAGKTTLAVHLAAAGHAAGVVSLIIDTDPQATASTWSQWRKGDDPEVIDCASPPLLARKLEKAAGLGAQLAVVDTPPHADIMTREACKVADLVLIPCRPRAFDLDAVRITSELAKSSGKPSFLLFAAGPPRARLLYAEASELVAAIGLAVAPVMLPDRAAFHASVGEGKTAQELEPGGKAAQDVARLWDWISQQVGIQTRKRFVTPTVQHFSMQTRKPDDA
jgi:chromosome partitioning protein